MKLTQNEVRKFFNPPMFDWWYKWEGFQITQTNIFQDNKDQYPCKRITHVFWRSKRTSRVKNKKYNYQISDETIINQQTEEAPAEPAA